jgi:hypothetical protein
MSLFDITKLAITANTRDSNDVPKPVEIGALRHKIGRVGRKRLKITFTDRRVTRLTF